MDRGDLAGGDAPLSADAVLWTLFGLAFIATLALDFFRGDREPMTLNRGARRSLACIGAALGFGLAVLALRGPGDAAAYTGGYLLELSLSVDNLFVFLLIFTHFGVPAAAQPRVLLWGILGAIVMRGVFITSGVILIGMFHWLLYPLGLLLVLSGLKLLRGTEKPIDPEASSVLRLARRVLPLSDGFEGSRFWVRRSGQVLATPLLLVLLMVETTDLVFAMDSIPAIFGITRDPLLAFTSNIFAVLGLRALYFTLSGLVGRLRHLSTGLAAVLVFIGVKMIMSGLWEMPLTFALGVVGGILSVTVTASLRASDASGHDAALAGTRVASPGPVELKP